MQAVTRKRPSIAGAALIAIGISLWGCGGLPKTSLRLGTGDDQQGSAAAAPTVSASPNNATASPAPVAPRLQPGDLVGADAQTADALLGAAPVGIIREGSGEIKRYAGADCMLLVILYPDNRGNRTVQAVEGSAARTSAPPTNTQSCLNGFDPGF
ncbi:MAG: hypothetical protein AAFR69_09575 [Pseudomonadota bacterium]